MKKKISNIKAGVEVFLWDADPAFIGTVRKFMLTPGRKTADHYEGREFGDDRIAYHWFGRDEEYEVIGYVGLDGELILTEVKDEKKITDNG